MAYDRNNIFAKIIRGEIPCNKVYEDDHALAFHDISPQRPVHVLIVPKGEYVSFNDFAAKASEGEIAGFIRAAATVAKELGIADDGYRILSNIGENGGQEVPHLHFHIFGGGSVGPMVT